jgi:hypothetical protein
LGKTARNLTPIFRQYLSFHPKYGRLVTEENYQQKLLLVYPQKLKVRKDAKALHVVLKIIGNPTYSV